MTETQDDKPINPFRNAPKQMSKLAKWAEPKITELKYGRDCEFVLEFVETMTYKISIDEDNSAIFRTMTVKNEGLIRFKTYEDQKNWEKLKAEEMEDNRKSGIEQVIKIIKSYEVVEGVPKKVQKFGELGRQLMTTKFRGSK